VELGLLLASRCGMEVSEFELHLDLSESEKGKTKQLVNQRRHARPRALLLISRV
jgi:predicted RNase H-related nuclease YkuK (DUF458 family)